MMRLARVLMVAGALLGASPALAKKPLGSTERIDLNQAPVTELMRLPGCGRKRAEAITAYRAHHPFRTTSEVLRVKGVKAKWYTRVKNHLSASSAGPLPSARPMSRPVVHLEAGS